jgi:predicted nucleotidyltransferase
MSDDAALKDPTRPEAWAVFAAAVRRKIARDLEQEDATAAALRLTVLPLVAAAVASARQEGLCREVWLFGSFVWGAPTERSDVDLLVAGCDDPMLLAGVVGKAAARAVHVVRLESADAGLRERVLRDGRAL